MNAVFDASVLAKLFLPEPDAELAAEIVHRHRIISFPDLARLEVSSSITRAHRNDVISAAEAHHLLGEWRRFPDLGSSHVTPFDGLLPAAADLSLTLGHPLPDCIYLALAAALDLPLVTADGPFVKRARPHHPRVRHLSEFVS